jgi:hypothetical protein
MPETKSPFGPWHCAHCPVQTRARFDVLGREGVVLRLRAHACRQDHQPGADEHCPTESLLHAGQYSQNQAVWGHGAAFFAFA